MQLRQETKYVHPPYFIQNRDQIVVIKKFNFKINVI
jgi:hypothetical protein